VFVLFERCKGEQSFWHPYFEAVDCGVLPALWSPETWALVDEPELRRSLAASRDSIESEWETIKKLQTAYPHFFGMIGRPLYEWAVTFVATRCFGWGLPATMLVPLADQINHQNRAQLTHMILQKNLHLEQNKTYLYATDFETMEQDKSESKSNVNVTRLFREDPGVDLALVRGVGPGQDAEHPDCFQRFVSV
jgi:hypothetical protein